jgi:putative lysine transport system permease protein
LIPQIGNAFVSAIKDTSVLNVISVTELYFMGRTACGTYFRYFEVFFIISIIYLVLTYASTGLLKLLEKKLDGDSHYDLINEAD